MLALRAKAETGWVLAYPAVLSGFLFFRYFKRKGIVREIPGT
uniref:Uncharacterized protein n=1 Tax=Candidatus Kentrum sp. LFY TaxID=2126342 RepID=A0A450WVV6_9GAMM|nr:MAG: hypothetical protein BECKLFY1418C_GA0070996_10875 [Candidatus Kentron sp. LFY]